jgi:hypothetical protein
MRIAGTVLACLAIAGAWSLILYGLIEAYQAAPSLTTAVVILLLVIAVALVFEFRGAHERIGDSK